MVTHQQTFDGQPNYVVDILVPRFWVRLQNYSLILMTNLEIGLMNFERSIRKSMENKTS